MGISVAILTGGQSSRMGRNKAFVEVGGMPIIERIIERVRDLGDELLLITNSPADYAHLGLPSHPDLISGKGPLGGLYTALTHSINDYTLVISCDQPFLNRDLLHYLIGLRDGFDVVVPLDQENYPQSMHAVYAKTCLEPIRRKLDEDRLRMIGFFPDVRVREVSSDEIDQYDPERYSFINVNSPDDLAEAERLVQRLG